MSGALTASQVAADIQREDGPDAEGLITAFRASPADGKRILAELASHGDSVVRAWAAWAASRSLPKDDAVAITLRLAKDRDSDVRNVAVEELVELDRSAAARLAGALRRKLDSKEPFHVVAWATQAVDEIRREVWNAACRGGRWGHARLLKGARWALWKNAETFSERQQRKLAWVQRMDQPL